jgi:hypothetical protein
MKIFDETPENWKLALTAIIERVKLLSTNEIDANDYWLPEPAGGDRTKYNFHIDKNCPPYLAAKIEAIIKEESDRFI